MKAALAAVGGRAACLYDGEPALSVSLDRDPGEYGILCIVCRNVDTSAKTTTVYVASTERLPESGGGDAYGCSFDDNGIGRYVNATGSFNLSGTALSFKSSSTNLRMIRVFGINNE